MKNNVIDKLVNAFLAWPLPASVCADAVACVPGQSFRWGTSLLSAVEARAMLLHLFATAVAAGQEAYKTEAEGDAFTDGYFTAYAEAIGADINYCVCCGKRLLNGPVHSCSAPNVESDVEILNLRNRVEELERDLYDERKHNAVPNGPGEWVSRDLSNKLIQDERQVCAAICRDIAAEHNSGGQGTTYRAGKAMGALECMQAIDNGMRRNEP